MMWSLEYARKSRAWLVPVLRRKIVNMANDEHHRLDELTDNLRSRLRTVCADWPEDMFEEVIRELAAITLKYEGSATPTLYDRRRTDRLVTDLKDIVRRTRSARGDAGESPESEP
jgi:hypothetical protein